MVIRSDLARVSEGSTKSWYRRPWPTHSLRHTYRSWLDSVGTPLGVQQKLMRHADIRTTMNVYGEAATAEMAEAHSKVVRLALP